ncbi:myb-like protein X [Saccostrea cucullata]|uniref:myb-like protein X n=1 Tax=Saccostrea cuccullata TaxID=36930 RepID=UPI002ED5E119
MGSESDIDELHSSILSLCEEDSQNRTLNQTLNLSPIKSNDNSCLDTPSHTDNAVVSCSANEFTPSLDPRSDKRFSFRTHSTPLMPKKLCSIPLLSEPKEKTVLEEEDTDRTVLEQEDKEKTVLEQGDTDKTVIEQEDKEKTVSEVKGEAKDIHEMTYEELLSEVTMLCELPRNHWLSSDGPSKLKMEDSIKDLNQTQLSKIDMDSILSQSYVQRDEQKKEEKPGRFASLSTTTSTSLVALDEEEDVELSEDILGLDEYIWSELDSDDDVDEESLLSGEETVIADKTLKNDRDVTAKEKIESKTPPPSTSENDGVVPDETGDNKLKTVNTSELVQKTNVDVNKNIVCGTQKRKENDFKETHPKKTKLSDSHDTELEEKDKRNLESAKPQSDVEYVVINLLDDSESDFEKSDRDEEEATQKRKIETSVLDNKAKVPTICVSPLVKHTDESAEDARDSQDKGDEEKYHTQLNYEAEKSYLKSENELTRSVMRKWNSNGIHNPDKNLTHATTLRKKANGMKGRLEGFHLSTLHGDSNGADPYMKSHVNTRSLAENINKLRMDMNDLEHYYYNRLLEMKCIFHAKMDDQIDRNRNRIRHLRIQQEMEARAVHYQHFDLMIKQCKLMQLKMDHQAQMNHMKCVAFSEEQAVQDEYSQKVQLERMRYEEQHNKLSSLVNQLTQREFEGKDDQFGPHIMVDLIKAPCRDNNESKSLVSVCLPLDIANAMIKEDEVYERFYEY